MSSTLKRQNHRIHPCNAARKNDLLNHLISLYSGKSILIITSGDPSSIVLSQTQNVTLMSDETLSQNNELTCDVLISYDLPDKAITYMSRFARAREYALILLGNEDQKFLYPIETLLGRTVIQETISGFEPDFGIAAEQKSKEEAKARRAERDEHNAKRDAKSKRDFKPRSDFKQGDRGNRDDDRSERKPFSGPREGNKPDSFGKKDAKPRFVGKDENGRPIFEGKTRERNHYIDGTPRSDAEKAARTPYVSKPKFFGKDKRNDDAGERGEKSRSDNPKAFDGTKKPFDKDKKPFEGKKSFGDKPEGKKPYGDKKPYDKKPYDKDGKKPFGDQKPSGDKKPYGDKKEFGDKKPYGDKKSFGDKKPYGDRKPPYDKSPKSGKPSSDHAKPAPAEPKRPPRRINVKSFKPAEKGE